mmetsp:Transcript_6472/g.18067  ORF Transcript_6472/g.18067 Transcript_6472/m.18067 type:complete len:231 (+) Transcript_6472:1817-2509(+)
MDLIVLNVACCRCFLGLKLLRHGAHPVAQKGELRRRRPVVGEVPQQQIYERHVAVVLSHYLKKERSQLRAELQVHCLWQIVSSLKHEDGSYGGGGGCACWGAEPQPWQLPDCGDNVLRVPHSRSEDPHERPSLHHHHLRLVHRARQQHMPVPPESLHPGQHCLAPTHAAHFLPFHSFAGAGEPQERQLPHMERVRGVIGDAGKPEEKGRVLLNINDSSDFMRHVHHQLRL